jgi:hypothetical protein
VLFHAQRFQLGERQFHRVLDQTADLEPVVAKMVGSQSLPIVAHRQLAVRPEVRIVVGGHAIMSCREKGSSGFMPPATDRRLRPSCCA